MLNFIKIYWSSIFLVIVFVLGLLWFYKNGKKDFVKKVVYSLVVQAEKALGSGTGELKYAMVVESMYQVLPTVLRLLITQKELDTLIEDGVQKLKEFLSKDKDLLGYDEEFKKVSLVNGI